MEKRDIILLHTSVLIDFFRRKKKENTFFVELSEKYDFFAISVVTKFEIQVGSNAVQKEFWENILENFTILPLTEECIDTAIEIQQKLKLVGYSIDFADLLIAATAKFNCMAIASLNAKHFNRIIDLEIVTNS